MPFIRLLYVFVFALLLVPQDAFAHEVYVLDHATIVQDLATNSPNPFGAFWTNQYQFFFWGFIVFVTVTTVFFASIFHTLESRCRPFLTRIKRWAPCITRITLGVCLVACAYNQGLFGPELPLAGFAGPWAGLVQWILYAVGFLILCGLFTRTAALAALIIFCFSIVHYGSYMLTYSNYLGEILITLILGGGAYSLDAKQNYSEKNPGGRANTKRVVEGLWSATARSLSKFLAKNLRTRSNRFVLALQPYAFLIARIGFGISIVFAAFYAKFLHSDLALDTIAQYHLTNYFHFDPLFIVLGALIIESLIGLFFILGVEVRWTAIFFLFWLALSLWYFGEAVWPHLILLGLNLAFIFQGYDRYSLEGHFFARTRREPVL